MNQEHLSEIKEIMAGSSSNEEALSQAMLFLQKNRQDYHWVGIYKLEGDTLVLGPYEGPHTDHVRIPVGRGVCGTAVAENKNQVIDDVRTLDNYLACNLETRAEIVVLIRGEADKILGQIDVDGTTVKAFSDGEEAFLGEVAKMVAPYM